MSVHGQEQGKLRVAVTLPDIVTIVEAVGGDLIEVVRIMPPGADPHSYTTTADDVSKIQSADLIVFANSEFLTFEGELAGNVGDVDTVDWPDYAAKGAVLKPFPGYDNNPHGFWLGFRNARAIGEGVATALIEHGLDSQAVLSNLTEFTQSLDSIDKVGRDLIASTGRERSAWVAMVPCITYTIDNLGLSVGAIVMPEGAGTASGSGLLDIHRKLNSGEYAGIVCALSEKDSKPGEIARQISFDTKAPVCYVKFLQADEGDSFWSISAYNAGAMAAAASSAVHNIYRNTNPVGSVVWVSIIFILVIWLVMLYRRMGSMAPAVRKGPPVSSRKKKS
jgi:zinc/manganese transport system substrate-binding protein